MEEPLFDSLPFANVAEGLRELWREAFADDDAFIDAFFSTFPVADVVHTLSLGGRVVAALYALPFSLRVEGAVLPAAYLYAVATAAAYRGRGYMRLLMGKVEELLRAKGVKMLFLLPADKGLRSFYARLGYSDCSRTAVEECVLGDESLADYRLAEVDDASHIRAFWERCAVGAAAVMHSPEFLAMNIIHCGLAGGGVYAAYDGEALSAVAFVINDNGRALLLDVRSCNASAERFLLNALRARLGVATLWRVVTGRGEPRCMGRLLEPLPQGACDNINISMMLDK